MSKCINTGWENCISFPALLFCSAVSVAIATLHPFALVTLYLCIATGIVCFVKTYHSTSKRDEKKEDDATVSWTGKSGPIETVTEWDVCLCSSSQTQWNRTPDNTFNPWIVGIYCWTGWQEQQRPYQLCWPRLEYRSCNSRSNLDRYPNYLF